MHHFAWRGTLACLHGLSRDHRGAVAITFAIASLALFILVATVIDYGRALALKQRMQNVLDDALVRAMKDRNTEEKVTLASRYFMSSIGSDTPKTIQFFYDTESRILTGSAEVDMPMTFGSAWGASIPVGVHGSGTSNSDKVRVLEIAMCVQATANSTVLAPAALAGSSFMTALDAALGTYGVPKFDQVRVRPLFYRNFGGFAADKALTYWQETTVGALRTTEGPAPQDMGADSGDRDALKINPFFALPDQNAAFASVMSQEVASGGNAANTSRMASGLECINEAMESSWTIVGGWTTNGKRVDVVYPLILALATDPAVPLDFVYSVQNPNYPSTMPRDTASFESKWKRTLAGQPSMMLILNGYSISTNAPMNVSLPPDGSPARVNNGYKALTTLPSFSQPRTIGVTSSKIVSDIAAAVANSYARTALAQ